MELFPYLSLTLATAAVFSYWNHRFLGLPTTIGVMVIAMVMSIGLFVLDLAGVPVRPHAESLLEKLDFEHAVLDVMLALLLFAGALHIDLERLLERKWAIGALATVGVMMSTLLVGALTWLVTGGLGLEVRFLHCLLFGALISPTDPIAVLGILKSAGAPKRLETKIAGESLFNDGIGVVLFSVVMALAVAGQGADSAHAADAGSIGLLLAREVLGSFALGLVAGYLTFRMLRSVDSYQVEVLLTVALATGLYSLAAALHCSGPLAVVAAGLLIGNSGRAYAMSPKVIQHVDTFWELVDEILNVVLFVLIGMELLILPFTSSHLLAGLVAIPLVLLARFLAVGSLGRALRRFGLFPPGSILILTWGGLRGGISVALALSIPASIPARDLILTMTYVVVVFSIVAQGLTVGTVVRRVLPQAPRGESPA